MNMLILEARAVIGVIAGIGITVVVIAREITERSGTEGSPEAVMPVVEAATRAGRVQMADVKAACASAGESAELTAIHAAASNLSATKSSAHVATSEGAAAADVAASEASSATAHVAASEASSSATAHVAASETTTTTTTSGRHGIRRRCCTERDGDEEDRDLAHVCLLLLLYAGR
jgi:hypothetical protein